MSRLRDNMIDNLGWRERPGLAGDRAPTLVCLHGIGSDAQSFDALAQALPADIRMIAWTMPGYGVSAPLGMDWPRAEDYAAALAGLADRLGLRRYLVLGHSLGTLIGAAHALAHADRIAGLVLVSCAQGMGVAPGTELPAKAADRLRDLADMGAAEFARTRAHNLVHAPDQNPILVGTIAAAMAQVTMPGYGQAVRMLAAGDLSGMAARLTVPTTVVVGQQDHVTAPEQSRAAHTALPAAVRRDLVELPGVGHALPQQAPGLLADIVVRVIAETATKPRGEQS